MDLAFDYIQKNHGIDTERSYPYEGKEGVCRYRRADRGAGDVGFMDIPRKNETALEIAVATVGPISVAIDAGHKSFQFYSHGMMLQRSPWVTLVQLSFLLLRSVFGASLPY